MALKKFQSAILSFTSWKAARGNPAGFYKQFLDIGLTLLWFNFRSDKDTENIRQSTFWGSRLLWESTSYNQ